MKKSLKTIILSIIVSVFAFVSIVLDLNLSTKTVNASASTYSYTTEDFSWDNEPTYLKSGDTIFIDSSKVNIYHVYLRINGTVDLSSDVFDDEGSYSVTNDYKYTGFEIIHDPDDIVYIDLRDYNTVTYDLNGGEGILPTENEYFSATEKIELDNGLGITKNNSYFIGWNTDKTATEGYVGDYTIKDVDCNSFSKTITFYAIYEENIDHIHDDSISFAKKIKDGLLAAGNYCLTDDFTLTQDITINCENVVNICLNGNVLDLNGYSIILHDQASLTITDCDEETVHYYELKTVHGIDNIYKLTNTTTDKYTTGGVITGGYISEDNTYSIYGDDNSSLTLDNVNFVGNVSTNNCLITNSNDFNAYYCNFISNYSGKYGSIDGVIFNDTNTATIKYCTFKYNTCTTSGAALNGSKYQITKCVFENNNAIFDSAGGACKILDSTIKNSEFKNNSAFDGGAIYGAQNNIYNCTFDGNTATNKGGAICLDDSIVYGSTIKNNSASCGGGIYCSDTTLTLIDTDIFSNTASTNGGGVYFYTTPKDCLAKGTKINMANGSYKNIEDVLEGEYVKVFDHETGIISSAKVFLKYKGDDKDQSFTLNFTNNIKVDVVGLHDFYELESNKYVTIKASNYENYIGHSFYNAIANRYEKLLSVTENKELVEYYNIYTSEKLNCIANDMLNVADDVDYFLNIFEFDSSLKINQTKLNEDIAKYGLATYIDSFKICSVTEEYFNNMACKYYYIALGKGLLTKEYAIELNESTNEYINRPRLSKLLGGSILPTYETYMDDNESYLVIGNDVNIYNNTKNEKANNVYISKAAFMKIVLDGKDSSIGLNSDLYPKIFIENEATKEYKSIFSSDNSNYDIRVKSDTSTPVTYDYIIETEYILKYDFNGGTGTLIEDSTCYKDESITFENPTDLARTDYYFAGWNKDALATEALDSYTVSPDDATDKVITLYAIWATYTITYETTYGTLVGSTIESTIGTEIKFPENDPTLEGYTFNAWFLDEACTIEAIKGTKITKDTTLYAYYVEDFQYYYAYFHKNGDDVVGEDYYETEEGYLNNGYIYLNDVSNGVSNFTYEGHTFRGWSLTPDGDIISKKHYFYNAKGLDTHFYAIWTPAVYNENYDIETWFYEYNGITGNSSNITMYYDEPEITFYFNDKNFYASNLVSIQFTGIDTSLIIKDEYSLTVTIDMNQVSFTNYSVSYSLTDYFNNKVSNTSTITIKGYSFNYHNTGADSGDAPIDSNSYKANNANTMSSSLVKEGYIMAGWSYTENSTTVDLATGRSYLTIDPTKANNHVIDLYPVWAEAVTISYDLNDADSGTIPQVQVVGKGISTITAFKSYDVVKDGYNFIGWSTNKEATTAEYEQMSEIIPEGDVVLYAVWEKIYYVILYKNDGTTTCSKFAPASGNVVGIFSYSLSTLTHRDNYIFNGWADNALATSGTIYTDYIIQFTLDGADIELYATWKKIIKTEPSSTNNYKVVVDESITGTIMYQWNKAEVIDNLDVEKFYAKYPTNISYSEGMFVSKTNFYISFSSVDITSTTITFDYDGDIVTANDGINLTMMYGTILSKVGNTYTILCGNYGSIYLYFANYAATPVTLSNVKVSTRLTTSITNANTDTLPKITEKCSYYCTVNIIDNAAYTTYSATSEIVTPNTITFDDGENTKEIYQMKGRDITLSKDLVKKLGYSIDSMTLDSTPYEIDSDYTVVNDVTFLISYVENTKYTLSYETNGGSTISDATISYIVFPSNNPTKKGYTFDGWYLDSSFEDEAVVETDIIKNTTIYAKWNAITHTCNSITFDKPLTQENINDYYDSSLYCFVLPTGNYYLFENILLEENDVFVEESNDVKLCLNDKVLNMNKNTLAIEGTFTMYDCGTTKRYYTKNSKEKWIVSEEETTYYVTGGVFKEGSIEVDGIFNFKSGNITENASYSRMIDIYNDSTFTMTGGNISFNNTPCLILINDEDAIAIITGGSITNNTLSEHYANIMLNPCAVNYRYGTLTLGGDITIYDNISYSDNENGEQINILVCNNNLINIEDTLAVTSHIGITVSIFDEETYLTNNIGLFASNINTNLYENNFASDIDSLSVYTKENNTVYDYAIGHIHYDDNSDIEDEFTITLNDEFCGGTLATGKYILLCDAYIYEDIIIEEGSNVVICLNGYALVIGDGYAIQNDGTLKICDCNDIRTHYFKDYEYNNVWELDYDNDESDPHTTFGGVITGGAYKVDTISNSENATLVLDNINIVGCYPQEHNSVIYNAGTLTIKNSLIAGNYSGSELIFNKATMTIDNSTITDNQGNNCALFNRGNLTLKGKVVISDNYNYNEKQSNLRIVTYDGVKHYITIDSLDEDSLIGVQIELCTSDWEETFKQIGVVCLDIKDEDYLDYFVSDYNSLLTKITGKTTKALELGYVITEQPTKSNNYTVVVDEKIKNDVTYKWYKVESEYVDATTQELYFVNMDNYNGQTPSTNTVNACTNSGFDVGSWINTIRFKYNGTGTITNCILNSDGYYYPPYDSDYELFVVYIDNKGDEDQFTNIEALLETDYIYMNETNAKFGSSTLENTSYYCEVIKDGMVIATSNRILPVKIEFNDNEAISGTAPTAIYQLEGRSITLPEVGSLVKTGYKFLGWNKNATDTTALTSYTAGSSNQTLYAIYSEKTDVSITEDAQTYTYSAISHAFELKGTHKDIDSYTIEYYVDDAYTTTAPTNAGSYNVRITRDEDDTYKAYSKVITNGLVINRYIVTVTPCEDDFTYDGTDQTTKLTATYKDVNNKDVSLEFNYMFFPFARVPNLRFVNAGSYEVYFGFATDAERNNYGFDNNVSFMKIYTMKKATVVAPTEVASKTYTGSKLTSELADGTLYTVTQATGTNVGSYDVVVILNDNDNYKWSTGEDTPSRTLTFKITKAQAEITVNQDTITITYGESVTLPTATTTFGEVECSYTSAELVDADTYTVTYTVAGTSNYDGDSKQLIVIINKLAVDEPVVTGTYTYSRSKQTVVLTGVETYMSTEDSLTETDADTYTITYTLDGNHEWNAGSDGVITWTIEKAKATIENYSIDNIYCGETVYLNATSNLGSIIYSYKLTNENEWNVLTSTTNLTKLGIYDYKVEVASTSNYDGDIKTGLFEVMVKVVSNENEEVERENKVELIEGIVNPTIHVIVYKDDNTTQDKTIKNNIKEEVNNKSEIVALFDIFLENQDGVKVENIAGNKYKVTLIIPEEIQGKKNYAIVYIKDDGTVEKYDSELLDDNTMTFITSHFSKWAIVADNEGLPVWLWAIIIQNAILLIIFILFLIFRKKDDEEDKKKEGVALKDSIKLAGTINTNISLNITKKVICDYLSDNKDVEVNTRVNYTTTGLPLADTHYVKLDNKKVCFTYVYELKDGRVFFLIKCNKDTIKKIEEKHNKVMPSAFPKTIEHDWYTIILDKSFTTNKDVFDMLDNVIKSYK